MPAPPPGLSLVARLLLAAGLVGGGNAAALGVWEFAAARDRLVNEEVRRSSVVASEFKARFNTDYYETLGRLFPEPSDVWSWDAHGAFLRDLQADFSSTGRRHGFDRVRTLQPAPNAHEAILADPTTRQKGALQVLLSTAETPAWRVSADYLPEMRGAWQNGVVSSRFSDTVSRGAHVYTWVPLEDGRGQTLALLEFDAPVGHALAEARSRAGIVAGVAFAAFAALGGVAAALARQTEAATARAMLAVCGLERGDLNTRIRHGGDPLLWQLEATRKALSQRIAELTTKAEEIESGMRVADAMLDGGSVARREAIARIVVPQCMVVDAGGSRRENADLLDLSFDHVVVRVQKWTLIDLAPGMLARLGWDGAAEGETELRVVRRIDGGDGTDYVMSLSGVDGLPGTPPGVADIAFRRAAVRVSALFTGVSASLLCGPEGLLAATVLDVGADGLGVHLPATGAALSATGTRTTVTLQLEPDQEEMQFGVIIHTVHANASGCRVGLQFDPDMTVGFQDRQQRVRRWVEDQMRAIASAESQDRLSARPVLAS
ncbi:MAG: PilZ domain-containing protein [Myxococcales bacterium]|nr:PilZ domain-containing protein [Myxococcales bacterium]